MSCKAAHPWSVRQAKLLKEGFMTIALVVIDMQVGLFEGDPPRQDADGVIRRVNEIAKAVRTTGGIVIFIQHEDDGSLTPGSEGWEILPSLDRVDTDFLLPKQACELVL